MKTRDAALALLCAIILATVAWFFITPAPSITQTTAASTPAPAKAEPVKPASKPIATPVVKLAPASAPQTAATNDQQKELGAAMDDIANLFQSGDLFGILEKYLPPDEWAGFTPNEKSGVEEAMREAATDADVRRNMQIMAMMIQAMKNETPEINAAGDQAIYPTPKGILPDIDPRDKPNDPTVFVKVDGRWYFKDALKRTTETYILM